MRWVLCTLQWRSGNYYFGGRMQIHWERWPRFYLHLGPWSSRSTRRDQGWINTRRVREELALRIQNGGLTTWHDTEKRRKSFLIWPTFARNFNLQMGKSFNSLNFMFFSWSVTIRVDPSWSDPDWRSELIRSDFWPLLYLPQKINCIRESLFTIFASLA